MEIIDVYIPCNTCGKLIPACGLNECLECRAVFANCLLDGKASKCAAFKAQKHGRWETVCKNVRKCSNCKKERNTDEQRGWYSCPFCGTIMDVEKL